eukprot:CAMPEP_0195292638 /NCGR_PEP_ID=MMETSP0707-20130614/10368_1 /TAXON_ID=33640 /ORGANISM="Asterionellopsis glacialis, Strain CCMP134" /LENGTH=428 /DNA_ID=CAMNT_0040353155 /DNA_START=112 /DNA_END=1395 /DNA_ORIENTATION=-
MAISQEEKKDETVQSINKRPVDREWLKKLLRKHSSDITPLSRQLLDEHPILQDKALVVAPMVDQSDLPFRLLCRKYGSNLCFTPMIHAKLFCTKPKYRQKFFDTVAGTPAEDRPVVAQFCGHQIDHVLGAATQIAPHVDAIDINCGCPQQIAKKGHYGAFLLEKTEELLELVRALVENLDIPVTIKVRILPTGIEDSLKLYTKLVDAGVHMITIHGRTRLQKGPKTGAPDWTVITKAVKLLGHRVPILANGGIRDMSDVVRCLEETGADGVMSSEAVLEYPPIFHTWDWQQDREVGRMDLAKQYMALARQYPPHIGGQGSGVKKCVRVHIHRFFEPELTTRTDLRTELCNIESMEELQCVVDKLERYHAESNHVVKDERLTWYMRHRMNNEHLQSEEQKQIKRERAIKKAELEEENADCMASLFGGCD